MVTGYEYDPTGNTISRPGPAGQQTLTWTPEGKLATVTDESGTTEYVYDVDGSRLLTRHADGSTTLYLPAGVELTADAAGGVSCTRYYAGVAVRTEQGLTWLAADHHNTATYAIDAATLQVVTRRSDPYGNPRGPVTGGSWPDDKTFLGAPQDPTGLVHLGAREYDPAIGRFISLDPIMNLSDPQQIHGYTYANNNPVTWADPTGLVFPCVPDGINICPGQDVDGQMKATDGIPSGSSSGSTSSGKQAYNLTGAGSSGGSKRHITLDEASLELFGAYYIDLPNNGAYGPRHTVQAYVYCKNFGDPHACDVAAQLIGRINAAARADAIATAVIEELLGISTAKDCISGKWGSCFVGAIMAVSPAKALKIGDILRDVDNLADAAGATRRLDYCSFDADTHVLMADGTSKPIAELEPGDEVVATNPESGDTSTQTVTAVWIHSDTLIELEIEDGSTVTTTADHPFWNHTDQQWQPADQLDAGDQLLTPDGTTVTVNGLLTTTTHTDTAYNLTIHHTHTYYVLAGETPVLVHNAPPDACRITSAPTSAATPSQTVFNNGTLRVDVENPVPGRASAANIHVQFMGRGADPTKYYYNPSNGTWVSEAGDVLASRAAAQIPQSAINRAFQYLGITP